MPRQKKEKIVKPKKVKEPKPIKPKRVKKLKLWFKIEEPPAGYRRANMKEALENKKVFYYGIKQLDTKLTNSFSENKLNKATLMIEIARLKGGLEKLKKDYKNTSKTEEEKKAMSGEYQNKLNQLNKLNKQYNLLSGGGRTSDIIVDSESDSDDSDNNSEY